MTKNLKVFIATSSFNEKISEDFRTPRNKKFKFIKNPIQKKLTDDQLIKYAKDCDCIIAGTETYNKVVIEKLNKLKYLFRMGSGIDNVNVEY